MPVVSNSEFRLAATGGENVKGAFRDVSKAANDAARSVANSNRRAADGVNEQARAFGNLSRSARANLTNVSFQVQDFAVQVAGGTSAVRALSQQLPQLLGGFGLLGAVAGTAVAVLGGVATALFDTEQASFDAADALSGPAVDGFERASKAAKEYIGFLETATAAQIELATRTKEAQLGDARSNASTLASNIIDGDTFLGFGGGQVRDSIVSRLEEQGTIDATPEGVDATRRRQSIIRSVVGDYQRRITQAIQQGKPDEILEIANELGLTEDTFGVAEAIEAAGAVAFLIGAADQGGNGKLSGLADRIDTDTPPRPRARPRRGREPRIQATPALPFDPTDLNVSAGDLVASRQAEIQEKLKEEQERNKQALREQVEAYKSLERTAQQAGTAIVGSFENAIFAGESFSDTLSGLGEDLARLAFRQGATTGINAAITGLFGPAPTANANGNAFAGGNIIPFARGGVVNRPTFFPMANGAGLMGEAGPEAVMPLRRGRDGRLGVESSGANVSVQVINQGPPLEVVEQRQERGDNGQMTVQLVTRLVDSRIDQKLGRGGQRSAVAQRFGLRPALQSA